MDTYSQNSFKEELTRTNNIVYNLLKKKAFCKIKVYRSLKKNKNTKLLASYLDDVKKEKNKLIES